MTTYNGAVTQSADDARQNETSVSITDTSIDLTSTSHMAGIRIQGVTIPPYSTINSAILTVNCGNSSFDDPNLDIYCENANNAAAFAAATNNISDRPRTTGKATWNAGSIGTGQKNTPDFAAAVQEVVNRGGWSSGNALAVILVGLSGCNLRFAAWDHESNPEPALTIDYTDPVGGRHMMRFQYVGSRAIEVYSN